MIMLTIIGYLVNSLKPEDSLKYFREGGSAALVTVYGIVDIICILCFTIELYAHAITYGLIGGKNAYLRQDVFNRIDAAVVFFCWIELACRFMNVAFTVRSFRLLRLMKPLLNIPFFFGVRAIFITLDIGLVQMCSILVCVYV